MIWVLLSMAVIILSIAVMVKGWDDLHGGMFHGGLIMIAIGIISISASIFYMNEGNIKKVIIYNFTPSCKKIGKSHFIDQPYDKTLKSMS